MGCGLEGGQWRKRRGGPSLASSPPRLGGPGSPRARGTGGRGAAGRGVGAAGACALGTAAGGGDDVVGARGLRALPCATPSEPDQRLLAVACPLAPARHHLRRLPFAAARALSQRHSL